MIKETVFDAVFDAQKSFRLLMDAFSHPGTIHSFNHFELNQPIEIYKSNAIIALSLFDNNIGSLIRFIYFIILLSTVVMCDIMITRSLNIV